MLTWHPWCPCPSSWHSCRGPSAAPWGPTCGAPGAGAGCSLASIAHPSPPPPTSAASCADCCLFSLSVASDAAVFLPGCLPACRAMILNVNEPETRGMALALQTMLDDLGKGACGALSGLLTYSANSRCRLQIPCRSDTILPARPGMPLYCLCRPGPGVCGFLHPAAGAHRGLQPQHRWLDTLRHAAAGHR